MKDVIYFDFSATTFLRPTSVWEKMEEALKTCASPARSAHGPALNAGRLEFRGRSEISRFFGMKDFHRLVFTKNVTESLNLVIQGLFHSGDHVISTKMEHNSVLRPLAVAGERGVKSDLLPLKERGEVDFSSLESLVRKNTRGIVVNHASNVTGNVIDVSKLGKFCRERGLFLVVDGAQSAGLLPVDVERDSIDYFCFTGHKSLYGPPGIGGVVMSGAADFPPLLQGGSGIKSFNPTMPEELPTRFEAGTANVPGIAGLLAGVEYVEEKGREHLLQRANELAGHFFREGSKIPGIRFYGNYDLYLGKSDAPRTPVVSLNLGERDSSQVADGLWRKGGICVRPGIHCAPLVHRHFHTEEQGMVRFSFSHFNTRDEVDRALEVLEEVNHR